jgi:ABC-type multidrug transport system fused ATPase/permease subunit
VVGRALLLRPARSHSEADATFSLAWLAHLVLHEKALLRDVGLASLTLSFLTIFPPLVVMSTIDKVLTHESYSTLALLAAMLAVATVFEALLGYSRRLMVHVKGTRLDAKLNLHAFNRLLLDYFERHPAGETILSECVPSMDRALRRRLDRSASVLWGWPLVQPVDRCETGLRTRTGKVRPQQPHDKRSDRRNQLLLLATLRSTSSCRLVKRSSNGCNDNLDDVHRHVLATRHRGATVAEALAIASTLGIACERPREARESGLRLRE